ncbi:MAG: AAA family ATPase [Coxiellaceae bacterium]|nr:AAA family ATPase [Coxiellaceae bacterium]
MTLPVVIQSKRVADMLEDPAFEAKNLAAYEALLESIIHSEIKRGANLERVEEVLSLRLGKKARLLAVKQQVEGKLVWVLLELLPNHKYRKAYFLKGGRAQRYLDNHRDKIMAYALAEDVDQAVFTLADDKLVFAGVGNDDIDDAPAINLREVIVYNHQIIQLTDEQSTVLEEVVDGLKKEEFVALVAGTPGSGKTLLAKEIIQQLVEAAADETNIYYVAESENLRREMREQCAAIDGDNVCFFDYNAMLERAGVHVESDEVGDNHLRDYFLRAQAVVTKQIKAKGDHGSDKKLTGMNFDQFLQECLVIAGVKQQNEEGLKVYMGLGGNHSLFHGDAELQLVLWNLCQGYLASLKGDNKFHPKLSRFDVERIEGNPVIVVDEALDLTRAQLQNLMAMGIKLVFVGDYNQDLKHTSHSMEYIKDLIAGAGVKNAYIAKLNQTHRCTKSIASIASKLLGIKKTITSHGSDLVDIKVESALDDDGVICIATPKDKEQLQALCRNVDTAVICNDGEKDNTSILLGTNLVFSIDEIKGLGYKRIILKDLITIKFAQHILAMLGRGKISRDDITVDDKLLITDLNNLFTAVSRAQVELIYINSNKHPDITAVLEFLLEGLPRIPINKVGEDAVVISTPEQWRDQAERLREVGNHLQAEAIFLRFQQQADRLYDAGDHDGAMYIATLFDYTLAAAPALDPAGKDEFKPADEPPVSGAVDAGRCVLTTTSPATAAKQPAKKRKKGKKKKGGKVKVAPPSKPVSITTRIDFGAPTKEMVQSLARLAKPVRGKGVKSSLESVGWEGNPPEN